MKRYILYILIILTINPKPVFSVSNKEIDIAAAIDLAYSNSDDLKINEENLRKLENMCREVRASVFPQIRGSVNINRFIEAPMMEIDLGMGALSIPMASDWENSIDLQLSQVLWAFGKVRNAVRIAQNYINMEKHSENITRNELAFAVKQMYYSILMAKGIEGIAAESYENALNNKEVLKERYSAGRISNVNNIKMEADIAGRIPTLLQAKQAYELVEVSAKDILGIADGTDIVLTEKFVTDFPEFKYEELKNSMLGNAPVLKAYREKLKLADTQIRLKKSSFYPTLSGFLNYSYSSGSEDIVPDEMNREIIAGLIFNYDIWDSGKKTNAYRQSVNDRNIAECEYIKMERALNVELKSVITEYRALRKTYEANRQAVKLAAEAYDIAKASYRSGAVSQTMLNDAELQLTGARMQELTTLYNINVAIAKIEKLTARNVK